MNLLYFPASSRAVTVPPDSDNASNKRCLRLRGSPSLSRRAEHARKKLPTSVALIDPKPITRNLIGDLLARDLPML